MQIVSKNFSNPDANHVRPDDVGRAAIYYRQGQSSLWTWSVLNKEWTSVTSAGGAAQSPWTGAINGGGFALSNVSSVTATSFVGALTGAASLNLLKAGGTMTGNLLFTDNTLDIGASGATRPRTGYFGTSVVSPLFTGSLTGAASLNVLKAGDTMTGKLTITQGTANANVLASTGYSLTGSDASSLIDLAGTWDTSGAPTGFKLNIVNTASGASARLFDFQLGGSSLVYAKKTGELNCESLVTVLGITCGASHTLSWAVSGSYLYGNGTTGAITGAFRLVGGGSSTVLNFGGDSASFPSLKQSSEVLQARLANDSAFAQIQGKLTTDANATTGLSAGVLAATTNATITITDASGQVYRVPCII